MPLQVQPYNLPFRLRQSSLEDAKCLYRFHSVHVLGNRDPEGEFATRGTHFHELAKQYVDFLRRSQQTSDWEYADELTNAKDWNLEAIAIFKGWARSQFIETEHIFETEYKVRLDWNFQPVDDDDPEQKKRVVFSADMDRLEFRGTEATVHDYKSHFMSFKPTTIQAVYYAYLIFRLFPHIETVKFQLEFVRYGISPEAREFTREDIPEMERYVEQQIARLIDALESNVWPAMVNSKCAYCMLSCPLVEAGLTQEAVGQVQTDERAAEMAQQLYALHLAAKRLHANLKNWATRSGTIDAGNDIRLGFKKVQKWKMEPKVIMGLNSDHGFAPTRALSVDSKEVKKIGKQYPEFAEKAYKSGKDKSTTAFKFWNEIGDPLDMDEEED